MAATASAADVSGSRIIVSGTIVGGIEELDGEGFLRRTTNDGATWSRVSGTTKADGTVVAEYRGATSSPKIVMAWDKWIADPAVHKLRFQRQA